MTTAHFNLQSTVQLLQRKWKQVLVFVIIALVVAAITLMLVPKYYKSTAIIVPANPALADKAGLFNPNIQGLYSYFGSGDDIDRTIGIASMDTVYKQLVDEFKLVDYYQINQSDTAKNRNAIDRRKAVLELREDLTFQKTDIGQLKLFASTKDKQLSANLVNRLIAITQQNEAGIWNQRYRASLQKLEQSIKQMEQEYTSLTEAAKTAKEAGAILINNKQHSLLEQITTYQKSANEFKLAIENNAPAFYVVEPAVIAAKSEKPNKPELLLLTALCSFIFGLIGVLVNNREPSL